jgi:hypothetical protein
VRLTETHGARKIRRTAKIRYRVFYMTHKNLNARQKTASPLVWMRSCSRARGAEYSQPATSCNPTDGAPLGRRRAKRANQSCHGRQTCGPDDPKGCQPPACMLTIFSAERTVGLASCDNSAERTVGLASCDKGKLIDKTYAGKPFLLLLLSLLYVCILSLVFLYLLIGHQDL